MGISCSNNVADDVSNYPGPSPHLTSDNLELHRKFNGTTRKDRTLLTSQQLEKWICEECPICLETYSFDHIPVKEGVVCEHIMCKDCALDILEREEPTWEGKCPLCRRIINKHHFLRCYDEKRVIWT